MHGFVLMCVSVQRHRSTLINGQAITLFSLLSPPPYFFFSSQQLGLNWAVVFGWQQGREGLRSLGGGEGGGGGSNAHQSSQVCSVIISALVNSPYSVSSV